MTRKETLALYRPIRAEIRRHLAAAQKLATREETLTHAEALSILHDGDIVADDAALDMLADTVVFMPNAADGRVIDRYVAELTDQRERGFARRISKAMFSVWEVIGRHPLGGVVVDDAIRRGTCAICVQGHVPGSPPVRCRPVFMRIRHRGAGPTPCGVDAAGSAPGASPPAAADVFLRHPRRRYGRDDARLGRGEPSGVARRMG
jgi:hypothetical protein